MPKLWVNVLACPDGRIVESCRYASEATALAQVDTYPPYFKFIRVRNKPAGEH